MRTKSVEGHPGVYKERDYPFGRVMCTLRAAIGVTQRELAEALGISCKALQNWEGGASYLKPVHLKAFIALALQHHAFARGTEAEEIRALWKAAHTKTLMDEHWFSRLLIENVPRLYVAREESPGGEVDAGTLYEDVRAIKVHLVALTKQVEIIEERLAAKLVQERRLYE